MSDQELILELTAQARELESPDGQVDPFLMRDHEILIQAAQRLKQLASRSSVSRAY